MQLILVSHPGVASGMQKAANFIAGTTGNSVCVELDEHGIEDFKQRVKTVIDQLDKREPVRLISDIPAGSPGNTALALLKQQDFNVDYLSGMNLGMILDLILSESVDSALAAGKSSIQQFDEDTGPETEEEDF
ncbi:PTS sugar transporter subunit IIA [Lactiplantibacillus daoliensis]|uniref:PTS sugar transporter subunit IIA n=1 Tax=Lactiplantibacillus daoliensis TaxID=2559916 RepID=A0ABW1UJ15_9LACO|nr:hypothetical protein [Lactiplantibacillus daoliensis]